MLQTATTSHKILASKLIPYNLAVDALGELALTLWLIMKGVNAERWREQAGTAGANLPPSSRLLTQQAS